MATGLGIAVVGERDLMGVAHLTLLPIELLGITMLAAAFPWRRGLAVMIVAGCVFDFALGIFLHRRVQHLDNLQEKQFSPAWAW